MGEVITCRFSHNANILLFLLCKILFCVYICMYCGHLFITNPLNPTLLYLVFTKSPKLYYEFMLKCLSLVAVRLSNSCIMHKIDVVGSKELKGGCLT
jgi:hypothetical protein